MSVRVLILMAIGVAAIAAWCAINVLRIVRGRGHGAQRDRPLCARCGYALGGWPTPICPECGQDVRRVGVRSGGSPWVIVLAALIASAIVILVAPLVATVVTKVLPAWRTVTTLQLTVGHGNGFMQVDYRRETFDERWRRQTSTHGEIALSTASSPGGSGVTIQLPDANATSPSREELAAGLRAADPSISDDDLPLIVDEIIDKIVKPVGNASLVTTTGPGAISVTGTNAAFGSAPVNSVAWAGGMTSSQRVLWYHWVVVCGITAALALLVIRAAHRSKARGWRAVGADEWARLPMESETH